ncbi:hypothetical protein HHK36_032695 [Tetracentron sinense]|nr:hypothetical protein HHK36_032695 [Tetracentron sinense]
MIGALLGVGTQMYSNALRKLPYMRHPLSGSGCNLRKPTPHMGYSASAFRKLRLKFYGKSNARRRTKLVQVGGIQKIELSR